MDKYNFYGGLFSNESVSGNFLRDMINDKEIL